MRQLAKRGVAFEALDNGIKSCADPKLMQRLCDQLSAGKIDRLLRKWLRACRIRFCPATAPPAIATTSPSRRPSFRSPRCSVFTRSGGVWTQQGNKLVGTGASVNTNQGSSVALSAHGNAAVMGGPR
jgi:hypothetical protein